MKDQPLLVLDLSKAFSDEARVAALEARRAKMKGGGEAGPSGASDVLNEAKKLKVSLDEGDRGSVRVSGDRINFTHTVAATGDTDAISLKKDGDGFRIAKLKDSLSLVGLKQGQKLTAKQTMNGLKNVTTAGFWGKANGSDFEPAD